MLRDLKREHDYSLGEQEEMLPFERDILLDKVRTEALARANTPTQGWSQYAKELGVTRKTAYSKNYRVLDD